MATLQSIKNVFHIRFRFDGQPYRRSLGIAVTGIMRRPDITLDKKQSQ